MHDLWPFAEPGVNYKVHPKWTFLVIGDDGSVWTIQPRSRCNTPSWRRREPSISRFGYAVLTISQKGIHKPLGVRLHRLILEAFVGPCPDGMEGCHNDDDKLNNRLSNLRWDTRFGNMADRVARDCCNRGEQNGMAKLSDSQRALIREEYAVGGVTYYDLGRKYKVDHSAIYKIVRGRRSKSRG